MSTLKFGILRRRAQERGIGNADDDPCNTLEGSKMKDGRSGSDFLCDTSVLNSSEINDISPRTTTWNVANSLQQGLEGNSIATESTNSASHITDSPINRAVTRPQMNPWQWHEMLVETEAARRLSIQNELETNTKYLTAFRQILNDALEETMTACRLTAGLATAHEQLVQALVLPIAQQDDYEDDDLSLDDNLVMGSEDECLPEKLKLNDDDDNETVEAAIPSKANEEMEPPVTQNTTQARSEKNPTCNDGSQPPVFSISFPNPEASDEAVCVLYKQHNLLQQTLSRVIPQAIVDKAYELKQLTTEDSKKLSEVVARVLHELQSTEQDVQKTWSTYRRQLFLVKCVSGTML